MLMKTHKGKIKNSKAAELQQERLEAVYHDSFYIFMVVRNLGRKRRRLSIYNPQDGFF